MLVLVALAMAALALARSTDVAGLIAGNMAFKRSALDSTDRGIKAAYDYVMALSTDTVTPAGGCYSASQMDASADGVPVILGSASTFAAGHPTCTTTGVDGSEHVYFYTERLCAQANTPAYDSQCVAAHVVPAGQDTGLSPLTNVQPVYRTTVRVDGPRSTTSFAQIVWRRALLAPQS